MFMQVPFPPRGEGPSKRALKGETVMKVKRKRIWIDNFQTYLSLRLALYFAVYMMTVWAWDLIDRSTATLLEALLGPLAAYWTVLSSTVVLLVGLLFIYDLVRFSHRVVGPLYRFRKCLKAIVE